MKRGFWRIVTFLLFSLGSEGLAFGAVIVSSLKSSPVTNDVRPLAGDWIDDDFKTAVAFTTGTFVDGYRINSVTIRLLATTGSPDDLEISLYSSVSGLPGEFLGSFSSGSPATAQEYAVGYIQGNSLLSPSTSYFLMFEAEAEGQGNFAIQTYNFEGVSSDYDSAYGWSLGGEVLRTLGSLPWGILSPEEMMPLSIDATPVPEVDVFVGLSALLLGGLVIARRLKINGTSLTRLEAGKHLVSRS